MSDNWIVSDTDVGAVVVSGTGVMTREQFDTFLGAVIRPGMNIDSRRLYDDTEATDPKVMTEIDHWNAAVDQRKVDKKARKGRA